MFKTMFLPQYIYNKDVKLNIKHFDYKNRNILKYLLFNYSQSEFVEEWSHGNLFYQKGLSVNYDKLNEFINSLYDYELQIINLERDNSSFNKLSEFLKIKHNVIYLVFYKKNRMEYNITFRFVLKPVVYKFKDESKNVNLNSHNCIHLDLIKKMNSNVKSYFKKFNIGHKNLDFNFYESLENKDISKRLYKNLEFISEPYYKVPNNYKYIQTFYKIEKGNKFYLNCIDIAKYILNSICEQTLSIEELGEAWYGANPLNLSLPIERLELIGLEGKTSTELPKNIKNLIYFVGNKNKLTNKFVKPIFNNKLLLYIK